MTAAAITPISAERERRRAKAQLIAHIRDNRDFSPSERLVVQLRIDTVNSKSGAPSYWSADRIAAQLGICVKTVRRADAKADGIYFRIEKRRGATNRYWLAAEIPRAVDVSRPGTKTTSNQGQKRLQTRDSRDPPTLRVTNKLNRRDTGQRTLPIFAVIDGSQIGDEKREAEIARELGADGYEILGALFAIDEGRPYRQLLAAHRGGLTEADKAHARALASARQLERPP